MTISLEYATRIADYGDVLRSGGVDAARASGGNPLDYAPGRERVTSERFAEFADAYREFYETADRRHLENTTPLASTNVDIVLGNPAGRSYTLPWFFSWLRREGRAPFADRPQYRLTDVTYTTTPTPEEPQSMTIPANPHIDHIALAIRGAAGTADADLVRPITPADMTPYAALADEFYDDRGYHGYRSVRRRRRLTPIATGSLLITEPRRRPGWMPMFFYWMQVNRRGPFEPATTVTTEEPRVTLPTSPRAAFATGDDAIAAAERWQHDDDPRLPNELAFDGSWVRSLTGATPSGYQRPTQQGRHDDYSREVRRGWDADSFTTGTPWSQGFWRDVRDLGYGTPAFGAAPAPVVTTDRAPLNWRDLVSTDYGLRERACTRTTTAMLEPYRADLERWIDSGTETHGITRDNLNDMISSPRYWTLSLPAFARWYVAQPVPATPAAIPADMITVAELRNPGRLLGAERIAERMEPWRKTFIRWVNEVGETDAGMQENWLTATLRDAHSSLARVMEEPHRMPTTLPRFAAWLHAHSQTQPDPAEPTVPSGDNVVPIGPEHPGWNAFWEQARQQAVRNGYTNYYETLARAFNVLPSRTRQTVRLTVDVEVELDTAQVNERAVTDAVSTAARDALRRGDYYLADRAVRNTAPVR